MKYIPVSLDDEAYRRARVIADQRDTSVSALVKEFLVKLEVESEEECLKELERETRDRNTSFRASDRLKRDELYESESPPTSG